MRGRGIFVSLMRDVFAAAALLFSSKLRPRKFDFQRATHCGCQPVHQSAPQSSIVFRARKGQRAEVRFDGISGCLRTPAGGSSRQTILVVEGDSIRVWFGGGDVASPDENLHGQIGIAKLVPKL